MNSSIYTASDTFRPSRISCQIFFIYLPRELSNQHNPWPITQRRVTASLLYSDFGFVRPNGRTAEPFKNRVGEASGEMPGRLGLSSIPIEVDISI
jgi:hypothetical protein